MKRFWLHPSFIQCWSLLFQVLRSLRNIWIHSPIWDPKLLKWANWCIYFSKDLVGFYVQSKCFLPYPLQICGMSVSMRGYLSNVIKHFSQTWQMLSDRSLKNSRNGREDSWNSHFKRLPSLAHGVFRFPWKRPCFFVWRGSKRAVQFHQSIFADGLTVTRSLQNAQTTGPRNAKLQIGRWPFSEVVFYINQP